MSAMIGRLEGLLAQGQDNALLRLGLGTQYFNQKDYQQAQQHLEVCLAQDANQSTAYKLLGRSYAALEEKEKARDIFRRGLVVAAEKGDKQVEKEITVFLARLDKP